MTYHASDRVCVCDLCGLRSSGPHLPPKWVAVALMSQTQNGAAPMHACMHCASVVADVLREGNVLKEHFPQPSTAKVDLNDPVKIWKMNTEIVFARTPARAQFLLNDSAEPLFLGTAAPGFAEGFRFSIQHWYLTGDAPLSDDAPPRLDDPDEDDLDED